MNFKKISKSTAIIILCAVSMFGGAVKYDCVSAEGNDDSCSQTSQKTDEKAPILKAMDMDSEISTELTHIYNLLGWIDQLTISGGEEVFIDELKNLVCDTWEQTWQQDNDRQIQFTVSAAQPGIYLLHHMLNNTDDEEARLYLKKYPSICVISYQHIVALTLIVAEKLSCDKRCDLLYLLNITEHDYQRLREIAIAEKETSNMVHCVSCEVNELYANN